MPPPGITYIYTYIYISSYVSSYISPLYAWTACMQPWYLARIPCSKDPLAQYLVSLNTFSNDIPDQFPKQGLVQRVGPLGWGKAGFGRPRITPWGKDKWLNWDYMSKPGWIVKPRINCESHIFGTEVPYGNCQTQNQMSKPPLTVKPNPELIVNTISASPRR
jgi:hypothetical protein